MKRINLKILVLFACILLVGLLGLFYIMANRENINKKNIFSTEVKSDIATYNDTVSIFNVPIFELVKGEYGEALYIYNNIEKQVTYDNHEISHLEFSPANKKIGFFYRNDYPSVGRDISLVIMDISGRNIRNVYRKSHKTSYWEWMNDNEVLVYYGCGTECMVIFVINVNTGEEKAQLQYGVGHEWSPNREYVLAYNYSYRYGITVGDKKEKIFLSIKRKPSNYNLIYQTKAIWSSDSKQLALIIKKEEENQMELLVFDVENNFKQTFQKDIDFHENYDFAWIDDDKLLYNETTVVLTQ